MDSLATRRLWWDRGYSDGKMAITEGYEKWMAQNANMPHREANRGQYVLGYREGKKERDRLQGEE